MGSGAELSCHLFVSRELGFTSDVEYRKLDERVSEVLRMQSALCQRVERPAAVDKSAAS